MPASAIRKHLPNAHGNGPGRVLVLDDQAEVAAMLTEMVRLIGYEAQSECDPHRALERVEEGSFDLVLSDFRMPEMNGQEFYRAAVEARPHLAQRIVFLTGDLLCDETQAFLQDTGAASIAKPFKFSKVEQTIMDVLNPEAAAE